MILPDVNVLIYAFRRDVPQHAGCRQWLSGTVSGDARFRISPLTLSALVRITTIQVLSANLASEIEDAFAF
jgi:predicted nucleic acid-binding protein